MGYFGTNNLDRNIKKLSIDTSLSLSPFLLCPVLSYSTPHYPFAARRFEGLFYTALHMSFIPQSRTIKFPLSPPCQNCSKMISNDFQDANSRDLYSDLIVLNLASVPTPLKIPQHLEIITSLSFSDNSLFWLFSYLLINFRLISGFFFF